MNLKTKKNWGGKGNGCFGKNEKVGKENTLKKFILVGEP